MPLPVKLLSRSFTSSVLLTPDEVMTSNRVISLDARDEVTTVGGAAVSVWGDRWSTQQLTDEGNSGIRPTLITGLNGLAEIRFETTNRLSCAPISPTFDWKTFTILFVFTYQNVSPADAQVPFQFLKSADGDLQSSSIFCYRYASGQWANVGNAWSKQWGSDTDAFNKSVVMRASAGTGLELFDSGISVMTDTDAQIDKTLDYLAVGSRQGGQNPYNGGICHLSCWSARASDAEVEGLSAYTVQQWGV